MQDQMLGSPERPNGILEQYSENTRLIILAAPTATVVKFTVIFSPRSLPGSTGLRPMVEEWTGFGGH